MSVAAILDVMMPLLEPDEAKRDDSRARFVELNADPDILYAWPRRENFDPEGVGTLDLERFTIRLAWATDASIEIAAGDRDRATTDLLYAKAEAIAAWVRLNRAYTVGGNAVWEHLQVTEVDYESLITSSVRGIYVDLTGYTLVGS